MLFNDPIFLFIFLPATVCAYIVTRQIGGARAVLGLLVLASMLFYAWWNPVYLPLLAGLAVFNFVLARRITTERERGRFRQIGFLLAFGVSTDLLVLAYFKYTDLFINTANSALGIEFPLQHILLPLGISFFTFQKIAYLADASQGEVRRHDFLEYCFFVMFFPQLIAGPIVHHREIFSQIQRVDAFSVQPTHLMVGLTIFLIGLFKKVVVADHLAPVSTEVFNTASTGQPLHFFQAWQGATAYTLQLYFDFSGYSDMAIGAARLFGVRLPINFDSPFQSTSIIEFWQRWHMTLSRFLRDYLYIPLGGNRKGKRRRYINLMLTMAIGGLWHGAAWTFLLWGFLHGSFLIINHAWRAVWVPIDSWWSRGIARLVTLIAVIVAFATFRAPNLEAAVRMYRAMAGLPQSLVQPHGRPATSIAQLSANVAGADPGPTTWTPVWVVFWLAVLWLLPNTQQLMSKFRPAFDYDSASWLRRPPLLYHVKQFRSLLCWRPTALGAALVGLMAGLAYLTLQHVSEFLYYQF
ncbi:MAG: alginate O-acetyltransferase complex protein AlgI [Rhodospirillaceae bacterium]|nr:alginate O-acetyltransferase complex protein AlgI [Rhodospirillaceae bacterium]